MKNIREPVGLVEAVKNIKKNCLSGAAFKKIKIKPPHVIFRLNDGQGRSRLLHFLMILPNQFKSLMQQIHFGRLHLPNF